VAFEAHYRVRGLGLKPNTVVPGWDEHFVGLVRENSKAANARAAAAMVEAQLEQRRQELFAQGGDLAVPPRAPLSQPAFGSPVASVRDTKGDKRSPLSAVLARFLKLREGEDGDRSAANDIAPIVQFAVDLWGDPCLQEVGPDQIVQLKQAMPEIDALDVDGPAVTLQQDMNPAISISDPRLADVLDPTFESGLVATLRLVDVKCAIDPKGRTCPPDRYLPVTSHLVDELMLAVRPQSFFESTS
jgi:hypothetical protein